jgi:hypothetical protein
MSYCADVLSAFIDLPITWSKGTIRRPVDVVRLLNRLLADAETGVCDDIDPRVVVSSRVVVKQFVDELSTVCA